MMIRTTSEIFSAVRMAVGASEGHMAFLDYLAAPMQKSEDAWDPQRSQASGNRLQTEREVLVCRRSPQYCIGPQY